MAKFPKRKQKFQEENERTFQRRCPEAASRGGDARERRTLAKVAARGSPALAGWSQREESWHLAAGISVSFGTVSALVWEPLTQLERGSAEERYTEESHRLCSIAGQCIIARA
eukprot:SAG11_NODE_278_length_11284_cov_202.732231_6_plen_113_part_00